MLCFTGILLYSLALQSAAFPTQSSSTNEAPSTNIENTTRIEVKGWPTWRVKLADTLNTIVENVAIGYHKIVSGNIGNPVALRHLNLESSGADGVKLQSVVELKEDDKNKSGDSFLLFDFALLLWSLIIVSMLCCCCCFICIVWRMFIAVEKLDQTAKLDQSVRSKRDHSDVSNSDS